MFWACKLCSPPPPNFTGRFTRSGLRIHLIRVHQSDLRRTHLPYNRWHDDVIPLSPAQLEHQQIRLLIRHATREERREIYGNLYGRNMGHRTAYTPVAVGGNESTVVSCNPTETTEDLLHNESVNFVSACPTVSIVQSKVMPAGFQDNLECIETDSIVWDSQSMWGNDYSLEHLPELGANSAVLTCGDKNAVTTVREVGDSGIRPNETSPVTTVKENVVADENWGTQENLWIAPPLNFADLQDGNTEEQASASSTTTTAGRHHSSNDGTMSGRLQMDNEPQDRQSEYTEKLFKDIILQIVAEKNTFRHQPDSEIAARISARAPSVVKSTDLEHILYAINISERMLIDRIYDILSIASNAEGTGQLAIAMLIQELRARTESQPR